MNIIHAGHTRNNFTSIQYKDTVGSKEPQYQELLNKIVTAFNKIELLTVVDGTRNAHLNFFTPQELVVKQKEMEQLGLIIVPLNKEGNNRAGYGNHSTDYDGGDDFVWRSIITRPQFKDTWKDIWEERKKDIFVGETNIGINLGYPKCCSHFFTNVWMRNAGIDTTWQQAVGHGQEPTNNTVLLPSTTPIWASNLLRWVGLKLVTHLPCSFNCTESKRIALENLGLATKYGYGYEYNKLCEMLDWEITWEAQYGVAVIDTPLFTINTVTDITIPKYKVIKRGHSNNIL